jgi:hypothetical protein
VRDETLALAGREQVIPHGSTCCLDGSFASKLHSLGADGVSGRPARLELRLGIGSGDGHSGILHHGAAKVTADVRPVRQDGLVERIVAILRAAWGLLAMAAGGAAHHLQRYRKGDGQSATGMHRLLDVHAAACAGDVLVAIGLAGTIFFTVPVGEARAHVAMYLLVTMAPFAVLAPIVGPVLDRFQHGRRYALATTMLARAFLAYAISDRLDSWVLYPAAFGVLVMSRAYGVARSAAVPRLLPGGMTLVAANARGSLAGIAAGGLVAPLGLLLAHAGPQWTLRLATVLFLGGMVVSLRLPPRADSDPPERVPRLFQFRGATVSVLTGSRIWCAITSAACFRVMYGFLTLFFAFRTRVDDFGVSGTVALGLIGAGLGTGSLAGTVIGARLPLRRPLALQLASLVVTTVAAGVAALAYGLIAAVALAVLCAVGSGLAKLAVDSVLQQHLPEPVRGTGFAHSESLLQLAFVAGGALGLIPLSGPAGLTLACAVVLAGTIRVAVWVWELRAMPVDVDLREPAGPRAAESRVDLGR